MRSMRFPWLLCLFPLFALAQPQPPMRIERDIPYAEPRETRRLLDIYAPASGERLPVIVWAHGGGWAAGSKEDVDAKPAAFTSRGYLFVAMNYRFVPAAPMGEVIRDVARSVAWVHQNIARYGGDPRRLILGGHSAGAQLAAILSTDLRYLEALGVPREAIRGCIPVDGDTYDVPLQVATAAARRASLNQPPPKMGHPEKFGPLALQREYSAVSHIAPNRGIAPFFILHVAAHTDTSAQAYRLWAALDQAGIRATLFGAANSEHSQVNRDLGRAGDPATEALWQFLDRL